MGLRVLDGQPRSMVQSYSSAQAHSGSELRQVMRSFRAARSSINHAQILQRLRFVFWTKKALLAFSIAGKWDLGQTCTGQRVGGFLTPWWGEVVGLWVSWFWHVWFIAFFLPVFFSQNHSYNILSLKSHYLFFSNSKQIIREADVFLLFQLVCNAKYKFSRTKKNICLGSPLFTTDREIKVPGSK